MTGIILDSVLMLLLVAAIGYGVRLEKKLKTLREGQLAFAGAVTELNIAAGRAEAALASLRASGQETDLLHDRIVKARAVKQELESLIARAPSRPSPVSAPVEAPVQMTRAEPMIAALPDDEDRARRMASLMSRIEGRAEAAAARTETSDRFAPVLQALAANQAAKQSLNRARLSLDDDLFAA